MTSWLEELERRESAARERAEELRREIAELSERLAVQEQQLSRLQITRETMGEILAGAPDLVGQVPDGVGDREAQDRDRPGAGGSPIGVMLVPPRGVGVDSGGLPQDYRDILEIIGDAGRPLRAGHVAGGLGISQDRSTVEEIGRASCRERV